MTGCLAADHASPAERHPIPPPSTGKCTASAPAGSVRMTPRRAGTTASAAPPSLSDQGAAAGGWLGWGGAGGPAL